MNILITLPNLMDSAIYIKLNSLYEAVVRTTSTGLRPSTRLTSLLQWQQEPDPRNKQKLELALDEMRNVCVGESCTPHYHTCFIRMINDGGNDMNTTVKLMTIVTRSCLFGS